MAISYRCKLAGRLHKIDGKHHSKFDSYITIIDLLFTGFIFPLDISNKLFHLHYLFRSHIYTERERDEGERMAEGVLLNLAEDILKNLGSRALAEIASAWGFKGQLEKLSHTINTIKDGC